MKNLKTLFMLLPKVYRETKNISLFFSFLRGPRVFGNRHKVCVFGIFRRV